MFKYNREIRYQKLIKSGFLPWEGYWLSSIPLRNHPALALIMRRRWKLLEKRTREADKKGWSVFKRRRIWAKRTRSMYRARGWIARISHPAGGGPAAGTENPFELYRFWERNSLHPMTGDSRVWDNEQDGAKKRWALDRAEVLLYRAKQARKNGNADKYRMVTAELDEIIRHSPSGRQKAL